MDSCARPFPAESSRLLSASSPSGGADTAIARYCPLLASQLINCSGPNGCYQQVNVWQCSGPLYNPQQRFNNAGTPASCCGQSIPTGGTGGACGPTAKPSASLRSPCPAPAGEPSPQVNPKLRRGVSNPPAKSTGPSPDSPAMAPSRSAYATPSSSGTRTVGGLASSSR